MLRPIGEARLFKSPLIGGRHDLRGKDMKFRQLSKSVSTWSRAREGLPWMLAVTLPSDINVHWRKTDNGSIINGIKVPYHQTLSTCVRGQVFHLDKLW